MKEPVDRIPSDSPVLSNAEIADRLASLAQLLSTQKENPYKVKGHHQLPRASATFQKVWMTWCAEKRT